ncbi:MAG: O-antigen ligase family protein [Zoogloea sp.]|nr:O-antigen ligase family protein [Zoogloea sp.]
MSFRNALAGLHAPIAARIPAINAALFASLFFFLPAHVAPAYSISGLILLLSVVEGRFAEKWAQLKGDPLFWIFQAFFWITPLSLLWTDDLQAGLRMVGRYSFFLLSPLYLTIARRELAPRCIAAFLAGCAMAEVLAYYNWLEMTYFPEWPGGIRVQKEATETAPFVDHILYAPILAWAGYLALREALAATGWRRAGFALLAALTTGNLIFSTGRTGQLVFLVLVALLIFQRFAGRHPLRAAVAAVSLTSGLAVLAYHTSAPIAAQVDETLTDLAQRHDTPDTATAQRLSFLTNSLRLAAENLLTGVGAGDFDAAYADVNARHTPGWTTTTNPHNQYLFTATTTGLGGMLILLLAYCPPILWRRQRDALAQHRVALVVFIAVISLFEDYLWRSNTSLLYVLFAVLLLGRQSLGPPADGRQAAPIRAE